MILIGAGARAGYPSIGAACGRPFVWEATGLDARLRNEPGGPISCGGARGCRKTAGRVAPARRPVAAAAVGSGSRPWPRTTPPSSEPSPRTRVLAAPFGFSLFYRRDAAPTDVTTTALYRGVVPFILLNLLGMAVIFFVPALATWLPRTLF